MDKSETQKDMQKYTLISFYGDKVSYELLLLDSKMTLREAKNTLSLPENAFFVKPEDPKVRYSFEIEKSVILCEEFPDHKIGIQRQAKPKMPLSQPSPKPVCRESEIEDKVQPTFPSHSAVRPNDTIEASSSKGSDLPTIVNLQSLSPQQLYQIISPCLRGIDLAESLRTGKLSPSPSNIFTIESDLLQSCPIYTNIPGTTSTKWYRSSWEVQQSKLGVRQIEASLSVSAPFVNFGPSASYFKEQSSFNSQENESETILIEQFIPKGEIDLRPIYKEKNFSNEFRNFFKNQQNIADITKENIREFFLEFGDIVPTKIIFGARRYYSKSYTQNEIRSQTKETIQKKIEASFQTHSVSVTGGYGFEGRQEERSSESSQFQGVDAAVIGGITGRELDVSSWQSSVERSWRTWTLIKIAAHQSTIDFLDDRIREHIRSLTELKESTYRIRNSVSNRYLTGPWDGCGVPLTERRTLLSGLWHLRKEIREPKKPSRYSLYNPVLTRYVSVINNKCQSTLTNGYHAGTFFYITGSESKLIQSCSNGNFISENFLSNDDANIQGTQSPGNLSHWIFEKISDELLYQTTFCCLPDGLTAKSESNRYYYGGTKDGKAHGEGRYLFKNGDVCIGKFVHGSLHGRATKIWEDGDKYEGDWKDGKMHGKGKYTFANGNVYEGDFKNNMSDGKGTGVGKDGDKYEGDWKNNKKDGKGTKVWKDGDKYEGDWKDGKMHGKGKYTYANGAMYEGDFKNDQSDGKGTVVLKDGEKYEGDWKDGKMHGKGKFTFANGNVYKGDVKNGKRDGKGIFIWKTDGMYEGDWEDDKMNGKGKRTYRNGDVYEGDWKNNEKDGKGAFV